jgi:hypothetical protein
MLAAIAKGALCLSGAQQALGANEPTPKVLLVSTQGDESEGCTG